MLASRTATAATKVTRSTFQISTRRLSTTATRNLTRTSIQIPRQYRSFSSSQITPKGLSPESSDPPPPNTEDHSVGDAPTELTDAEYHEIADQYMNSLVLALEEMADGEKGGSEPVEVEFAVSFFTTTENHTDIPQAGVLTVGHPKNGSYVLNKQPPNKQIWLSSPISGPKRFDWTVPKTSGGMNSKQDQEDSHGDIGDNGILGGGKWIYLRDGSTLSGILKEELGVVVARDEDADVTSGREGPGASGASPGAVEG